MNVVCNPKKLFEVLSSMMGCVEKRQDAVLGAMVHVQPHAEGTLLLSGSDGQREMMRLLVVEAYQGAEAVLWPAKRLYDLLRVFSGSESITIESSGTEMRVEADGASYQWKTMPAEHFPSMVPTSEGVDYLIESSDLKALFHNTLYAVASHDVRYFLNGLFCEIQGRRMRCVGTDGHRLASCTRYLEEGREEAVQVIIPKTSCQEILKVLSSIDQEGPITVRFYGAHVLAFKGQGWAFHTKLIEAQTPHYDAIFLQKRPHVATISPADLKQALQRLSVLFDEKTRGGMFAFEENLLVLTARNRDLERAEVRLPIHYEGEVLKIAFNLAYLLEYLQHHQSETLEIALQDAENSACLRGPEHPDTLHVIMPMRL